MIHQRELSYFDFIIDFYKYAEPDIKNAEKNDHIWCSLSHKYELLYNILIKTPIADLQMKNTLYHNNAINC